MWAKLVKQKRGELELTQEELATLLDISVRFVSDIERGIRLPSQKTKVKIADVLGLWPELLLDIYSISRGDSDKD